MLGQQFCSCSSRAHYAVLLIMQSGLLVDKRKEMRKGRMDGMMEWKG